MKLVLLRQWGLCEKGSTIDPNRPVAEALIARGFARPVIQRETASIATAEAAAMPPARGKRRGR